jgi:F-type H+-transporting ATPase subunit gamma
VLVAAFMAGAGERDTEEAAETAGAPIEAVESVDELHLVYTQFKNMVTQTQQARRMAPMEVEYADEDSSSGTSSSDGNEIRALYTFEPDAETLFDALLPRYVGARLFAALLESAASESANRQRAMKAATDNANELIRDLTLESNQARQAQITQEISEIVGGADALVTAGSES